MKFLFCAIAGVAVGFILGKTYPQDKVSYTKVISLPKPSGPPVENPLCSIGDAVWVEFNGKAALAQMVARNNSRCVVGITAVRSGTGKTEYKIYNIRDVIWTKEKENENGKQ